MFAYGQTLEIQELTENIGILPINLGPAKLERNTHTLVHYYDIEQLLKQYEKLNQQHINLKVTALSEIKNYKELQNYDQILEFIKYNIRMKIDNIIIYAEPNLQRTKRGLINGLGTVFKYITGNLDAEDGKRYNKILKLLRNNQNKLEEQIKESYSINNQIITNFNNTLLDIQHNEEILKSKIIELATALNGTNFQNILFAKNIYDQLIILYNSILNVMQDIENSISFCRLRTLHPSIIKTDDLLIELKRISKFYKSQLSFKPKKENILEIESILKVNCKIEPMRIVYFISIPINYETNFDLYYLYSIPMRYNSEYHTIIPNIKYLLMSNNQIVPLNNMCVRITTYQCPATSPIHYEAICEEEILQRHTSNKCQFTNLNINQNFIEIIPETNNYLVVFPKREEITIKCPDNTEIKTLIGIHLIKDNKNCEILFRNKSLYLPGENQGQQIILPRINFELEKSRIANYTIELKPIKLNKISMHQFTPIKEIDIEEEHPNIWIITIIIIILIISGIAVIIKIKRIYTKRRLLQGNNQPQQEETELQVPGGTSF